MTDLKGVRKRLMTGEGNVPSYVHSIKGILDRYKQRALLGQGSAIEGMYEVSLDLLYGLADAYEQLDSVNHNLASDIEEVKRRAT